MSVANHARGIVEELAAAYADQITDDGRYGVMSAASRVANYFTDADRFFDKDTFLDDLHAQIDVELQRRTVGRPWATS